MAVKAKAGEDFSESAIQKAIAILEAGGTKKEACQVLNIKYNTTRLNKIIQEYRDRKERVAEMRKRLRSKPVDISEKKHIVQGYLSNESIQELSNETYRSAQVVKNVLKTYNVPLRTERASYFSPLLVEHTREDYKEGDLVFSARYGVPAYIKKQVGTDELGPVYRIWLTGKHAKWAYQPFYELADLTKLQKELNISIVELDEYEIKQLIVEGLLKAKKNAK